jgi:RING-H2 zinc finger domain
MKYKKRSLKKKRQQQRQRQRHHFSKKYVQRGGGFMDIIAELIAMEGRTHTCMAVHPTQPLVVVGDDAGIVTLFEINPLGQGQPKKLAQLTGLPSAVKCLEFHKTIPVVAGGCSDRVLMWRFDQISRQQEQQQEGAVQQLEPSHTVSVFELRSKEEVEQELSTTEQNLAKNKKNQRELIDERVAIENKLGDINRRMMDINDSKGHTSGADILERMLTQKQHQRDEKAISEILTRLEPLRKELKELQAQEESMNIKRKELIKTLSTISIFDEEKKIRHLKRELEMIRIDARDEVSCITFYPHVQMFNSENYSFIAVGVNNRNNIDDNRIIIYRFNIEPSSSVTELYTIPPILFGEPPNERPDDVLMASFSDDGKLFAFVTKSSDGRTVLKVRNFKGSESRYYQNESKSYRIDTEKKRAITSIRPYSSSNGQFNYSGIEYKHNFLIGCDDGSLTIMQAITQNPKNFSAAIITKVTDLKSIKEWNSRNREAIECVAVHPILHLFASGSLNSVKLWGGMEYREALESLVLQPGLVPVRSAGFNENFLAVCGPGNVRIYSCNADDYRGFKEELQKELESGSIVGNFLTELELENRTGDICPICSGPMNDPLTQPALRHGPEDAIEGYLTCGHKFHKKCIEPWLARANTCPSCRTPGSLVEATPQRIIKEREESYNKTTSNQSKETARSIANDAKRRIQSYERRRVLFGQPAAAPVAPEEVVAEPEPPGPAELTLEQLRAARLEDIERRRKEQQQQQQQQPPSENGGGGIKNKYSRKKYNSKKSKIRRRYSKKYKY